MIPTSVLVNNITSFLDHDTWKSFSIVSKDIYKITLQKYPPWPTDRMIIMKENIRQVSFDQTEGNRLAILANTKSPTSVAIYDRRKGFIERMDFGVVFESGQTSYISYICLLDNGTLMVAVEVEVQRRNCYRDTDRSLFLSNIGGSTEIVPFPCSQLTGSEGFPLIFNWKDCCYIATVCGDEPARPKEIYIHQYMRGADYWPNCMKETHCLKYPVKPAADSEIISTELHFLPQDEDSDHFSLFTISEDLRSRHVHCWRLDHPLDRKSDGRSNTTTDSTSCGIIPRFIEHLPAHVTDIYDFFVRPPDYSSKYKIVASPFEKGAFLIIQTFPNWWSTYQSSLDLNTENLWDEHTVSFSTSNVFVWEYNAGVRTSGLKLNADFSINRTNAVTRTGGFDLNQDFSITERNDKGTRIPLLYSDVVVSNDGRRLILYSKKKVSLEHLLACNIHDSSFRSSGGLSSSSSSKSFTSSSSIDGLVVCHFEAKDVNYNPDPILFQKYKSTCRHNEYNSDNIRIHLSNDEKLVTRYELSSNKIEINYLYDDRSDDDDNSLWSCIL